MEEKMGRKSAIISQSQLPWKHDSESANGYNSNGGKKPAKKSNKARCDKEWNREKQKNQKNKQHFIFPFHLMVLL